MSSGFHFFEHSVDAAYFFIRFFLVQHFQRLVTHIVKLIEMFSLDFAQIKGSCCICLFLLGCHISTTLLNSQNGSLIKPHRLCGLMIDVKVCFGFLFDDLSQVFFSCIGKVAVVSLFASWYPRCWIRDKGVPVDIRQEWMLFQLLDSSRDS